MKIILDGNFMTSKTLTHLYLKEYLDLPAYYGNNLDALWDVLSTHNEALEITLINQDQLIESLGDYGEALIEVFVDTKMFNKNFTFKIE